ncbi:16S rRNA (cytidine(1402)-2'-O)-methyltransferase [Parasphaerochaeta coccoides]|uniref:Ribosomal RNA small subunit methyltransferase I n=1 Tax=Parasphaerochaeta coccoides (strain ATCC BAA-1237 / DSM 17374 / SPN1) TaxID=760011 RepID=F4GJV7_PARC1|nr:16S rRNA (cytidine(1402)-2'-O)-methyltransferase [Parasphaerochaeta coccoides]AEC01382.1 Ribosomal RNA small subunit methyltransferase I [Parasphaerochaeta coccoides DSM 17374]
MNTLFIVATPIGNLDDITLRALDVLRTVDVIACEDTRHTGNLLNKFSISKRLISTHARNEEESAKGIISLLGEGKDIAYVSDAGTPGISDPGSRLVRAVRDAGFPVVPIPGVSALATLVSASGLVGRSFSFDGFPSTRSGRRAARLEELVSRGEPFILYESPFRIVKLLDELAALAPQAEIVLGREMTKIHEEFLHGTASGLAGILRARPSIKGEFAVIVRPVQEEDAHDDDSQT